MSKNDDPMLMVLIAALLVSVLATGMVGSGEGTPDPVRGATLEVGPGKDHPTIGEAISAAVSGDTILVYPGTYDENIVIDRTIDLKGVGPSRAIIEGTGQADTIEILAGGSTISNLTISSRSPGQFSGIRIRSDNNRVQGCFLTGNSVGIFVQEGGMNRILENTIYQNTFYGAFLQYSDGNIIENNTISDNNYGGIKLNRSSGNLIIGNGFNRAVNELPSRTEPVGYWKMDETAWSGTTGEVKDSSGLGNDGRAYGGANTALIGMKGRSGYFDGSNDQVGIPHHSTLVGTRKAISMQCWVHPTDTIDANRIVTKKWQYYFEILNGRFRWEVSGSLPQQYLASTVDIPTDQWTHLAGTWDGTTMKLYVNGRLDNSQGRVDTMSSYTYDVYIGNSEGETRNFNGYIDELRLYDRELSRDEILMDIFSQNAGVYVANGSNDNILKMNDIERNLAHGIHVDASSSNNMVFHNNFMGNNIGGKQAHDSGPNNEWYHSGEGNHWSDIEGADTDRDGIVDIALRIEGQSASRDEHPLVDPFGILRIYGKDEVVTEEDRSFSYEFISRGTEGETLWSINSLSTWIKLIDENRIGGTPTNGHVGYNMVNITAAGMGQMTWSLLNITVVNVNDDPEIVSEDIPVCTEDRKYRVVYEAIDPDPTGDQMTWSLDTNAGFLDMYRETLEGTPGDHDVGSFWVNVSVHDGNGGSDLTNFTLTVVNVNDPPEIAGVPKKNCLEDELYWIDLEALDPDPGDSHIWLVDTEASFLSIDRDTGNLSGIPVNSDVGEHQVSVSVSDRAGRMAYLNYTLKVQNVNDDPVITSELPGEMMEDMEFRMEFDAVDVDPVDDILLWRMDTNATFLSLERASGILRGRPDNFDVGSYFLRINVTDGAGGLDERNFTFVVVNVNDHPALNSPPSRITIDEDSSYEGVSITKWFIDIDGDRLVYQFSTPEYLLISIDDDLMITITPVKDWSGEETITFFAADLEAEVSWNTVITVKPVNDAPYNATIVSEKLKFRSDETISLAGVAKDPDIPYGDDLNYLWYDQGGALIGKGSIINIDLPVGENLIRLNVTDTRGEHTSATIMIEVYEERSMTGLWIGIVLFLVILVSVFIAAGVIIIRKRMRGEAADGKSEGENRPSGVSGLGEGYSAGMLSGPARPLELQPVMHSELPASTGSEQLPPAPVTEQVVTGSDYIRPSGTDELVKEGFKAPPAGDIRPFDGSDHPVSGLPTEGGVMSEILGFLNIEDPSDINARPAEEFGISLEEDSKVWSPEMAESRAAGEAKTALEMLHELNELRNEGAITEEEYESSKKRLLRKI